MLQARTEPQFDPLPPRISSPKRISPPKTWVRSEIHPESTNQRREESSRARFVPKSACGH
jgi:hypothetical protein